MTIALLMWFGLPRDREPDGRDRQSFLQSLGGYREVMRNGFFWRMVLMSGAVQGCFISMQTLWLGPWFTRVLQMTPQQSAGWLFAFNATLLGAYLLVGYLAPRVGPQESATVRVSAVGALLVAGLVGFTAAFPPAAGPWGWLALAMVATVFTPIQARVG